MDIDENLMFGVVMNLDIKRMVIC